MVNCKFKKGFSFAEILISMLILSLFFLAGAKVITQKQKDEVTKKVHGFYECYWDGGLKFGLSKIGERPTPRNMGQSCLFATTRNNSLFEYTIIYPNELGAYTQQQFMNSDRAEIIPPSEDNLTAQISDENGTLNNLTIRENDRAIILNGDVDNPIGIADDMESAKNKLQLSVEKANILIGDKYKNGAVIINW